MAAFFKARALFTDSGTSSATLPFNKATSFTMLELM
jgi:hypothetical protein